MHLAALEAATHLGGVIDPALVVDGRRVSITARPVLPPSLSRVRVQRVESPSAGADHYQTLRVAGAALATPRRWAEAPEDGAVIGVEGVHRVVLTANEQLPLHDHGVRVGVLTYAGLPDHLATEGVAPHPVITPPMEDGPIQYRNAPLDAVSQAVVPDLTAALQVKAVDVRIGRAHVHSPIDDARLTRPARAAPRESWAERRITALLIRPLELRLGLEAPEELRVPRHGADA